MNALLSISVALLVMALFAIEAPAADAVTAAVLVGTWVQDDTGPVLVHRRRYRFQADGSYELSFTSRNLGSTAEKLLAREVGTYRVDGNRLVISPKSGPPKVLPWRIEKDLHVGDTRLVMQLPDGILDIYYPQ
jgi:hypothetical protein